MSKDRLLFIDFYPGNWSSGVSPLSCEARGAYITILAYFWEHQKAPDDDDQANARRCNVTTHRFKKLKNELMEAGKIELRDGCLWNDRAVIALENSLKKSAGNSAKARTAAETRWSKYQKKSGKSSRKVQPFPDILSGKNEENMEVSTQETAENSQSDGATSNAPSNAPSNASQSQSQNHSISTSLESSNSSDKKEKLRECEIASSFQFRKKDEDQFDFWLKDGLDPDKDIIPIIKRLLVRELEKGNKPRSLAYYNSAVRDAKAKRLANGPFTPIVNGKDISLADWCKMLKFDMKTETFASEFVSNHRKTNFPHGNPPTMPGCSAPPELQLAILRCWGEEIPKWLKHHDNPSKE